ncbi:hypothetical protein D3C80_1930600 [compost metagenome]
MPQVTAGRLTQLLGRLGEVEQIILDLKRHAQRLAEAVQELGHLFGTLCRECTDPEAGGHQHRRLVKGLLKVLLERQIIIEGMLHLLVLPKAELGGSYG